MLGSTVCLWTSWCSGDVVPDGVGDELLHDVSSEQHDATGDLVDPITSYASSLLYPLALTSMS